MNQNSQPIGKPSANKRIVLINRDFQLRYTRIAVVMGLLSTVLTMILVLFPLFQFRILRSPAYLPPPFLVGMLGAALVNFILVAYCTVLLTHRIAGPMFSLVRQFRLVAHGKLSAQFTVRKEDELKFVIRNFNEMIDSLTAAAQRDLRRVENVIKALKADGDSAAALGNAEELRRELVSRLEARNPEDPFPTGGAAI